MNESNLERVEVVTYPTGSLEPGNAQRYQEAFRLLNLEWIERYFKVEPKDLEQVNNPMDCLNSGGQIFFCLSRGEITGTCALYKVGPRRYELAKMAVRPDFRGKGLGELLMAEAEAWAIAQGADEILILSNTILSPAIQLYKKSGFEIWQLGQHPDYQRCNIELRKSIIRDFTPAS